VGESHTTPIFFSRVMQRFDDGSDEKPLAYGGKT